MFSDIGAVSVTGPQDFGVQHLKSLSHRESLSTYWTLDSAGADDVPGEISILAVEIFHQTSHR